MALPEVLPRSSSSPCYRWKYDVFLNFRGTDTRQNFVSHLDTALIRQRIKVFKDEKTIPIGRYIFSSIYKAIEESRISVVVLSPKYGESVACLDELVKIIECSRSIGRCVIPVFYQVQPGEVKHQSGCFREGFVVHGNHMKLEVWRNALNEVANIAGIEVHGNESDCIKKIVDTVLKELGPRMFPLSSLLPKSSAYWCSLSFLTVNREARPRLVGTALYDTLYTSVHIGRFNRKVVAIKEIHASAIRESDSSFLEEVSERSRMKHVNVAKLFGYCIKETRRFLVEEHGMQGTLHQILHGGGRFVLSLTQRVTVAYDVAKGLEYLHDQDRLGHIDSCNVLLFRNFNAKISSGSSPNEFYQSPEYNGSEVTMRGNVYSFGVLLFELLTGTKPSRGIVRSVLPKGTVDNVGSLVDPKLNGNYDSHEVKKLASAMLSATMHQPSERPDMKTLVEFLNELMIRSNRQTSNESYLP